MPQKIFEIDLDIKNPDYKMVSYIEVVSGDTDTNIFNIQLFEDFVPVNASGNTAVIIFGKPDGTTVFQNLTIVDATKGQYVCTLSSQTIAVPGRIKAEVALYEGTKKLTSIKFEFVVRKPILDEKTVESSNEFSALTEALNEAKQWDRRIATVEQKQVTQAGDVIALQNEVLNSAPVGTVSLSNTTPVTSIDAKVNGGLNFEMEASPLLVNLLGRDGDCEDISKWVLSNATCELDSVNKIIGKNSIKLTLSGTTGSFYKNVFSIVSPNKYYAAIGYTKNGNCALNVSIQMYTNGSGRIAKSSSSDTGTDKFRRAICKLQPSDWGTGSTNCLVLAIAGGAAGQYAYFDGIILIEITAEEYALPDDVLMAKYPYVNGIQPMMGLHLQSCAKNLVRNGNCEEGISRWAVSPNASLTVVNGKFQLTSDVAYYGAYIDNIPVKPNTNYYLNYVRTGASFAQMVAGGSAIRVGIGTFNSGNNTSLRLNIANTTVSTGTISEIQLVEGTTAPTEYKSWEGSELLIDGEFAGIGTYLDELSYENGVAKVLRKIKKVVLDGNVEAFLNVDRVGYKLIYSRLPDATAPAGMMQKYDGSIMQGIYPITTGDQHYIDSSPNLEFSISDTDSGWGENLALSAAEVKALMNGWKMNNGTFGTPYNGTGTKTWTKWNATDNTGAVTVCPTTKADGWSAWATLWYALATPVEEILDTPINGLSVYEGKTTISLQTGIVKEKANIEYNSSLTFINSVYNDPLYVNQSFKIKRVIAVLKNGTIDNSWRLLTRTSSTWIPILGEGYATNNTVNYDPTAIYEVLYEVLHEEYNSQQVSLTAEYTENLRDSHNELVKTISNIRAELGDLWTSLLPLADKELAMSAITLLATETTTDIKAKVNEILNLWR